MILTNLHAENVSCRTEVLHGKLQPHFPNEFGELVVLIALGESDRLDKIVGLLVGRIDSS